MSSEVEELMPLALGKGISMRLFVDHSKPEDSPEHNWVDTRYDGQDDSEILAIPNHWHKDHDEVMEVLEGKMIFYLDGKKIVASAGDPPVLIPRGHVHGFTVIKGQTARFTERTKPSGTFKAHFFQDLFQQGSPGFLMAMRAFYDGDTFVSLPGGFKTLDYVFLSIVGFIAKAFVPAKPSAVKSKVL
ncbi:hypothetical protein IFR04_007245 [Cadophora malorum]|uniref:Cupin type-2 domain-containing protein n=1 Tax=Cadophora malorum TaxID=108018 RepID=A0A8H7TIZ3_9HELO|nr:hypothetical protein IFR04_007245 [Cadophora malorum]